MAATPCPAAECCRWRRQRRWSEETWTGGRGGQRRRRKKSERYGGQLRGWTLESIQGEPARGRSEGVSRVEGREFTPATEFLQDLVSHELTHQRVYTRQTHSRIKSGHAHAQRRNILEFGARSPSIFRKHGRRNSPSRLFIRTVLSRGAKML